MPLRLLLSCLLWSLLAWTAGAQEPKETAKEQPKAAAQEAAKEPPAGERKFEQVFVEWKNLLGRLQEIQSEYQLANLDTRPILEKEFNALVAKGESLAPVLIKSAETAYLAAPNENKELAELLAAVAFTSNQSDNYEEAARLGKLLLENKFQSKGLDDIAGTAAFEISDYDAAEKFLKQAEKGKTISPKGVAFLADIAKYRDMWAKEQEIRAAEATADDLPRVQIKTNRGDIILEMFENEAPNTVANFISLVEKKYYDGTPFHRVLPGFMAQGGDPQGTGSGGPGYTIPDECRQPNYRKHFRGSLSMAKTESPDTGGSQFFLMFRPTGGFQGPPLDAKHTVFGRVIEGIDVLAKLKKRDPEKPSSAEPDKIVEAKVLRKRDHEYKPKKTGEK